MEGVAFFEKSLFTVFELPEAQKTSKKPFRLVNYEVLVGENVKSFDLAALFNVNLASRGALFGAFGVSVFERPWTKNENLDFC